MRLRLTITTAFVLSSLLSGQAEVDVSKLPAPASTQVLFDRDIKPILEKSCLKCHGAERPKSGFTLITRQAALKGGDMDVAIISGDSARSPMIHYVAGLVEDMEMPPTGKGDPLTPQEISLLRAWIDQGAPWGTLGDEVRSLFSISPTFRAISVSGNERLFQEHTGLGQGIGGGIERLLFEHRTNDLYLRTEGKILANPEEYQVQLEVQKRNVGTFSAGFEQWTKFYDEYGGAYEPFPNAPFALDRNLSLDQGRAWVNFGLTIPDLPKVRLGYEHQYRQGEKSTLQWGDAGTLDPGLPDTDAKKIFPAAKAIDDSVHILKLDVSHEWAGLLLEDNLRIEWAELQNNRNNTLFFNSGPNAIERSVLVGEGHDQFSAVNVLRLEKPVRDWLFLSGGYLYNRVDGQAAFSQSTFNLAPAGNDQFWFSQRLLLEQDSHVFNLNSSLGPWRGLSLTTAFQNEWQRQRGLGDVNFDEGVGTPFFLSQPAILTANIDRTTLDESATVRFTGLPFTTVFVEARLQQEWVGQFEEQFGGTYQFLRDTDIESNMRDFRAGFSTSPGKLSFSASVRQRLKENEFAHLRDEFAPGAPNVGYSAFITGRDTKLEEIETRLVFRPARWLKTTLRYQLTSTDYTTQTDPFTASLFNPDTGEIREVVFPGRGILAGEYNAHTWSIGSTWTPLARFYLNSTFSVQKTAIHSASQGSLSLPSYEGTVFNLLGNATFLLSDKTDLQLSYLFSTADYGQADSLEYLPVGVEFDRHSVTAGLMRRFKNHITGHLGYGFFLYEEPRSRGLNEYLAHAVFATLTIQLN